jgi:putative inorganic carbon (HCO3(-)) transporter
MNLAILVPAGLVAVLILAWAARHPIRTILPVYAFLVPIGNVFFLRVPLPPPFNTLSSMAGALAIGAIAIHLLIERRGRVPTLPVGMWLLFVGWAAMTAFWAVDPKVVGNELTVAIPLLALLVLVSFVSTDAIDLRVLRDAVVASGAVVGGYGLLMMVSVSSANTNPNQLAAGLLLPLVLAVDLALEGQEPGTPRWRPVFGGISAVLTAFAIAISGSRGGAMAAVVGFVATLILWYRWQPWRRHRVRRVIRATGVGILSIIGLLAITAFLFPGSSVAGLVVSDPVQRLVETSSSSGRAEIWTTGALACKSHCGVGSGLGTFRLVYSDVVAFSDVTRNVGFERPGHNLYLEVAVETGVVGIVLFFLAVASEWRALSSRRTWLLAPALAAAILAILLADVFEAFLWFKHGWLPFVLIRVLEGAPDAALTQAFPHRAASPVGRGPAPVGAVVR